MWSIAGSKSSRVGRERADVKWPNWTINPIDGRGYSAWSRKVDKAEPQRSGESESARFRTVLYLESEDHERSRRRRCGATPARDQLTTGPRVVSVAI